MYNFLLAFYFSFSLFGLPFHLTNLPHLYVQSYLIYAFLCLLTHTLSQKKNKDAHHTQIHFHRPRDADLLEQFCRDKLPSDDIYVPAHHQPVNPEDEDDVVPDQHAAFGIQRATQAKREPAWRDFGLGDLMGRGPEAGAWRGVGRGGVGPGGAMGKKGPSKMPR